MRIKLSFYYLKKIIVAILVHYCHLQIHYSDSLPNHSKMNELFSSVLHSSFLVMRSLDKLAFCRFHSTCCSLVVIHKFTRANYFKITKNVVVANCNGESPNFWRKNLIQISILFQGKTLKAGSWRTDRTFQLKGDVQIPKTWV